MERASWIRKMFEAGIILKQQYGEDAVCDFSLGNPDLPAPAAVGDGLRAMADRAGEPFAFGYMPNGGYAWARQKLATHLSAEQGVSLTGDDVVLTCGAAGGLNAFFRAVLDEGDEVLSMAPYFVEYGFYVENHGGVFRTVKTLPDTFGLDLDAIELAMTPPVRARSSSTRPTTRPGPCIPVPNSKGLPTSSHGPAPATVAPSSSSPTNPTVFSPSTVLKCHQCFLSTTTVSW